MMGTYMERFMEKHFFFGIFLYYINHPTVSSGQHHQFRDQPTIPWRYLNRHDKLPKLHDNTNFFVRHRRAKRKADSDSLGQNPNIITQ